MAMFQRHQLEQNGDSYTITLYLDPSLTEFADDLGQNDKGTQEKLTESVRNYVNEKFPNLKVTAAKVMLGSMLVASVPLGAMTAQAAEAPPTPAPAVTTQAQAQAQLPDVQGTKYETVVNNLVTLGIVAGKDDGKYHSGDQLSRAEFAKFAVYAAGYGTEAESLVNPTTGYGDVAPNYWGAKYIKMAKDKGLMKGTGYNQFNPTGNISYEEVATVLLRLQGYSDEHLTGTWPGNYVAQAKESGITANSEFAQGKLATRGEAAIILHNSIMAPTVTYNSTTNKYESNGADKTIFNLVFGDKFMMDNGKVVVTDQAPVSIANATANTAKSLRLVFNKPVTDTSAVAFTVTRNGINVSLTPSWSTDKKTVELSSTAKLLAGDYTVKLSGIDTTGVKESTVSVQAEKISSVEIAGETMVQAKQDKSKATMTYNVYNQYGDNVTKDPIARDISWTSSVAGTVKDNDQGLLTLDADRDLVVGEKIVVTGIDSKTGTVITKTLTVGEMATITDFQFGDLKYPEGVNKIFTGESQAVRIPFKAIDQYGNTITDIGQLASAVQLLDNVDKARFSFAQADDGGIDIVFDTSAGITTNQKVVLTVVSSATGTTRNMTFDVVKPAAPATIDISNINKIVAAGDADGTLVIPITVTDQFGTQLTTDQIANNATKISISATGALQNAGLHIATSGANKGKIVNGNPIPSTPKGASVIVVTVPDTGKSSNITVNVRDERVLSDVISPEKVTNNLMQGASYNFSFQFRDQYGEVMSPTDNTLLKYKVKIEKVSGEVGSLVFKHGNTTLTDGTVNTDEGDLSDLTVTADGTKTGSYRITAQLVEATNEDNVVSQSSLTFNNVEATGALTYDITGVPDTIYGGIGGGATSAYAIPIKVTAKDAQGRDYVVNPADIVSVASDSPALKYANGKIYGDLTGATAPTTQKVTLTVNFNTKEEVKSITKEVTVSKVDAVFGTFGVYNSWYTDEDTGAIITDVQSSLPSGVSTITNLVGTFASGTNTATVTGILVGQDQYGRYQTISWDPADPTAGDVSSVQVTNLKGINKKVSTNPITATVTSGSVVLNNVDLTATGDHTARLIVTAKNGKVAYYNITVNAPSS